MVDFEPTGIGALFEAMTQGQLKPVFSRLSRGAQQAAALEVLHDRFRRLLGR